MKWKHRVLVSILVIVLAVVYCEFFIFEIAAMRCRWPSSHTAGSSLRGRKALFLTDTHLLGPYRGHWLDKLKREWQMRQAFRAITHSLAPDVVFFLGDLFDEGEMVDEKGFKRYVERFRQLFPVKPSTDVHVLIGNHDVGFHNQLMVEPHRLDWFKSVWSTSFAKLVDIGGIRFILLNSMAFRDDGCSLCQDAKLELHQIVGKIKSVSQATKYDLSRCRETFEGLHCVGNTNQPILLQHFPLYRHNEENCNGEDGAHEKWNENRQSLDVVSQESSNMLLDVISPFMVISGHTHHGCVVFHRGQVAEISVPSFSWRNINNPSVLLGITGNHSFAVNKCRLPRESTCLAIYTWTFILILIANILPLTCFFGTSTINGHLIKLKFV